MIGKPITTGIVGLLVLISTSLDYFSVLGRAQQKEILKKPVQFVDASTGKPIRELLVVPRHSSFTGVSTLLGEGPGRGTDRDYLAKPFIYHAETPFILKLPKSRGLPLVGFVFIGKGRTLAGVVVFAPGYRPHWYDDLWYEDTEKKVQLTPISESESLLLLDRLLGPLEKGARRVNESCSFWGLPARCNLRVHFNKKERELVRSFLQRARKKQ